MIIVSRAMDMYNYILGWNNYNKPLTPFPQPFHFPFYVRPFRFFPWEKDIFL